ncbi:MAG: Fic family protein [Saprospiraceae bacterium]|nr:Fic family protein [Saprospiraceae bacterium]
MTKNIQINDISFLLSEQLSTIEKFYYAAVIHLLLLKIHPFNDGNGRTARLIEKWFLAEKLGEQAWFIPSEKYYYQTSMTITKTYKGLVLNTKRWIMSVVYRFC